jgi:hypothetical protein
LITFLLTDTFHVAFHCHGLRIRMSGLLFGMVLSNFIIIVVLALYWAGI